MRLYDWLLRLYPRPFRRRYGDGMRQVVRDRRRDVAGRGAMAVARFWIGTMVDAVRNGVLERHASRSRAGRRAPRGRWLSGRDVRTAVRILYRQPGLTLTVLVTLGLGVGANTAVFSVVRGVVLQPLPYPEAARLVQVYQEGPGRYVATPAAGVEWERRTDLFDAVGTYLYTSANLTDREPAERIPVARVSGGFFEVLGVAPELGRTLRPADAREGAPHVTVISHAFWLRRFEGQPDVLGRTVRLSTTTFVVVGVMPDGFEDLSWRGADLWLPLVLDPDDRRTNYRAIARLGPGVGIAAADGALDVRAAELNREYGQDWPPDVSVRPLREAIVGGTGAVLFLTQLAAALVLLIACANLANLLLARAAARQREFAVRAALGAGRGRLVAQVLAESIVLALAGGLAGLLVAVWSVGAIVAALPADMPRLDLVRVDAAVLATGMIVAGATGVLFGLAPALRLSRTGTDASAWVGDRSGDGPGRQRPLRWLIAGEVALAVVLLAASGVAGRELLAMQAVDVGLRTDDVIAAEVSLPTSVFGTDVRLGALFGRIVARAATLPGAMAAGVVDTLPLSQSWSVGRYQLSESADETFLAMNYRADATYFSVVGIPLVQGRLFEPRDDGGPLVVVVSRRFADRHWQDGTAVGRRVWLPDAGPEPIEAEVVGVVGDVYHTGLDEEPQPSLYFSFDQVPSSRAVLVVRADGDPRALIRPVRLAVSALDPTLPLFNTRTVGDLRSEALGAARVFSTLTALTAMLALILGVVGVYGVVAFNVAARRRETGVRLALGGKPGDVARLFLVQGLKLTGVGLVVGIALAVTLGLVVLGPAVEPAVGAATLAGVAVLLAATAAAACYVPARRVFRFDPSEVMRCD